jgi:hypothetical protein
VLYLGAMFIVYHLAAMLTNGAPHAVRDALRPLFVDYGEGLRMTANFGVFARYTHDKAVAVYGVTADKQRHLLSHSSPGRSDLADARVSKILRRLKHEDLRELFGKSYLAYYCRSARESGLELERTELTFERESRDEVVLKQSCRRPRE